MFRLTNEEITRFYLQCHGPTSRANESINEWENRMLDLLGPDDCQFIIRSREGSTKDLYIMAGHGDGWYFHKRPKEAAKFSWGETAVRCTNNRKLEALRIVNQTEAISSRNEVVSLLT